MFVWNKLNNGGAGRGEGVIKLLNVGGDGGGNGSLLLLLLSNLLLSFRNASNLFCISKSTPDLGAFWISSLAKYFFSNIEVSKESTNNRIVSVKRRNVLKNQLERILPSKNVFRYWIYCLPKARVVKPVPRYIVIYVCFHSFEKVTDSKKIFLDVFRLHINIVSNSAIKVRGSCTVNNICQISIKYSNISRRKSF